MADVGNFTAWSSTAAINSPSGSTAVSTGLDDNLREIQAQVAVWRDGTGYGILTVTSVSGSNTITGSTSPAPALAANQKFLLQPAGTNTGATTLNLNGAGAKNVYACNAALNGGEFHTSVPVLLEYDGTAFQVLGPVSKQQTRTTYSSGSGTYSLPGGCTRLVVRLVGGGGAGGPGGGAGAANGTAGGDTTFGVLTGNGGAIGTQTTGGAGGSASGGLLNIAGGSGQGPLNGGSFGTHVCFMKLLGHTEQGYSVVTQQCMTPGSVRGIAKVNGYRLGLLWLERAPKSPSLSSVFPNTRNPVTAK
jgi:hypothetical protein